MDDSRNSHCPEIHLRHFFTNMSLLLTWRRWSLWLVLQPATRRRSRPFWLHFWEPSCRPSLNTVRVDCVIFKPSHISIPVSLETSEPVDSRPRGHGIKGVHKNHWSTDSLQICSAPCWSGGGGVSWSRLVPDVAFLLNDPEARWRRPSAAMARRETCVSCLCLCSFFSFCCVVVMTVLEHWAAAAAAPPLRHH